jgi:hypothetical protein
MKKLDEDDLRAVKLSESDQLGGLRKFELEFDQEGWDGILKDSQMNETFSVEVKKKKKKEKIKNQSKEERKRE